MTTTWWIAAVVVAGISYLLGSINSAIIVSKLYAGDDIRKYGSGNAGMTNMLRTYGKGPAAFTALGDFFKAVLAVALGRMIFGWIGELPLPMDAGYLAGLFVLLGHLFPVYFHFKGGKGAMTTLGVMLMVSPIAFLILAGLLIPLIFFTRIVSLSSIIGAIAFPFVIWGVGTLQNQVSVYEIIGAAMIGLIILWMHRDNICRLLAGTENRFGKAKK